MRRDSYLQFRIITADTYDELTEKLNRVMFELRHKEPGVEFEGHTVRIRYKESELHPEDLTEEYRLKGVDLHCLDCPFFDPLRNKDGSVNRAAKRGSCRFATYGETSRDRMACEKMFEMLNRGEIKLVKGVEEC